MEEQQGIIWVPKIFLASPAYIRWGQEANKKTENILFWRGRRGEREREQRGNRHGRRGEIAE